MKGALDKDFEYMDNELSMIRFKNVVKWWLKIERCTLKTWYMVGKRDYPINIEPIHWEKLKSYWFNFKTKKKVEQMSNTKNKVKNMGNVGQLCKTGKNAKLILVN